MTDTRRRKLKTIYVSNSGECFYCGRKFTTPNDPELTIDHVIPKSLGGSNDDGNLVPCCIKCNQEKNSYLPSEWIKRIEFKIKDVQKKIKIRKKMIKTLRLLEIREEDLFN